MNSYNSIPEILAELKAGHLVIVVDDEGRENEGDFVMAAEKVTPAAVNFLASYGRGLICVALTKKRAQELNLPLMVANNTAKLQTAFTVSVDAINKTNSGISAYDRAQTIRLLVDQDTTPHDLARPGHIFPVQAVDNGVLQRHGHTEAAVDLMKIGGLAPVAVICEIMDDDGNMAREPRLFAVAKKFGLKITTVQELIKYRLKTERLVKRITTVNFPTQSGRFRLHLFRSLVDGRDHLTLEKGRVNAKDRVLTRIHSQCLTGDVFHSARCDCGAQLKHALGAIEKEGAGLLLYMCQEGRGIGLANKILAYSFQDQGQDTVQANQSLGFDPDLRDYSSAAQILQDLGVKSVRLITNNPEKIADLREYGVEVAERVPSATEPNIHNLSYLETKRKKMGHFIDTRKEVPTVKGGSDGQPRRKSIAKNEVDPLLPERAEMARDFKVKHI